MLDISKHNGRLKGVCIPCHGKLQKFTKIGYYLGETKKTGCAITWGKTFLKHLTKNGLYLRGTFFQFLNKNKSWHLLWEKIHKILENEENGLLPQGNDLKSF